MERVVRAGGAGLLSALAALGAGEPAAGALRSGSSPVVVVGGTIIALLLCLAILLGLLAGTGRRVPAAAGVAGLGLLGVAAAVTRPAAAPGDLAVSLAAAVGACTCWPSPGRRRRRAVAEPS